MRSKLSSTGIILVLIFSLLLVSSYPINFVSAQSSYHDPVEITGDEGFLTSDIVVGGNGTPENPYIIANWIINATGSWVGISIKNTRAYFVIRNVTIYGSNYGVYLENVSNFIIENSRIFNIQDDGIETQESSNGRITGNTIYNASVGIKFTDWDGVIHSPNTNITVDNNHIY
ncbi:right-handed parallel beta-helix repeat-containing protein [Thermococcus stetteri]|uniref:right-handed parallel beta-helix repeat-containing protein n=1 Tax=Thermococcus stetteri TaxID=49900 RepID=UPI001AE25163|nr:right-handed parallel beta-helix repeat-containing protein [Thermococcus stetteri]MBP1912035.1 parallel beta-helix repeat protein [Thermococcus stetteri]